MKHLTQVHFFEQFILYVPVDLDYIQVRTFICYQVNLSLGHVWLGKNFTNYSRRFEMFRLVVPFFSLDFQVFMCCLYFELGYALKCVFHQKQTATRKRKVTLEVESFQFELPQIYHKTLVLYPLTHLSVEDDGLLLY